MGSWDPRLGDRLVGADDDGEETASGVSPVRVPKASDVLADQLRRSILDGRMPPGRMLPTERALAEESRLSRTAVREALRILEIEGLVSTRPGRAGGSFVRRPDAGSVARSIEVFIRGRRIRFHAVLETREQIEPICAELAALNRTDEELPLLEQMTQRVEAVGEDVPSFLTANANWHVTIARVSHNELLAAFMLAIARAVRAATDIEDFNSPEVRTGALRAHRRVVEAIVAGDAPRARAAMERHVRAYREQVALVEVPEALDVDASGET